MDQMQCFLVVKVNSLSSVLNYNQTHLNIEEDQKSVWKCAPQDLFTFCKSMTSYWENNQNILFCCLYSCICHSQTWILVIIIKINIYNIKRWRRFTRRTTATATVHCWCKMGSASNWWNILTQPKKNILITNRTTTCRRNDELRNVFLKNKRVK